MTAPLARPPVSETLERATRRIPKPGRLVKLWPRVRPYRGMLAGATVAPQIIQKRASSGMTASQVGQFMGCS